MSARRLECLPCLEPQRCYVKAVQGDRLLSRDAAGRVVSSTSRSENEEWILVPVVREAKLVGCLRSATTGHWLCAAEFGNGLSTVPAFPDGSNLHKLACLEWTSPEALRGTLKVLRHGGISPRSVSSFDFDDDKASPEKDSSKADPADDDALTAMMVICNGIGDVSSVADSGHASITTFSRWQIEFLGGEICFIVPRSMDKRLRCRPLGYLSWVDDFGGWTVWRLVEQGAGLVAIESWAHKGLFLCSDINGAVSTTTDRSSKDALWFVTKRRDDGGCHDGVFIRSAHQRVLSSSASNVLTTIKFDELSEKCPPSILWSFEPAHRNEFYLSSVAHDSKRLCCTDTHEVKTSPLRNESSEWSVKFHSINAVNSISVMGSSGHDCTGFVTIEAPRCRGVGWYLAPSLKSDNESQRECVLRSTPYRWRLEMAPQGTRWFLRASDEICSDEKDALYLACVKADGPIIVTSSTTPGSCRDATHMWTLEPRLPDSITGYPLPPTNEAGIPTASVALAAPLGEGYKAGFPDESSEKVSLPTGTVDRTIVSTLQSMGTLSLGTVGVLPVEGGGLVVGGATTVPNKTTGDSSPAEVLSTVHNVKTVTSTVVIDEDGEEISLQDVVNRPFANWRNW
jgi:hypothetical protein